MWTMCSVDTVFGAPTINILTWPRVLSVCLQFIAYKDNT